MLTVSCLLLIVNSNVLYCRLWESVAQDRRKLHLHQAVESKKNKKRGEKLLAQQKEVKRLSNLLTVELLQPPPEIKPVETAAGEIAKVLAKQDIE
eukprot:m.83647 g.83647  ORF g.83647 m.83647 type:complete len:95 (+) comp36360_c1_seq10:14-298(+)